MTERTLGRRDLLLASGEVLTGAGTAAQTQEKPRRLKFMVVGGHPDDPETGCDHAEAFVLHPQSPEAPGLPQGPA
jgi:hypothetical protein